MRHTEQTAVVTGGSQGIGRAIAEKLAAEGARVIVGSRKPPARALPAGIEARPLDVADEASVAEFFAHLEASCGRLDILVNSAGVMLEKPFLETSVADWDLTMAINLRGAFLCSRQAAELMRKTGGGAIVNIGSVEGLACNPDHAPYAASKGGLHALTRAVAVDLGRYDIRCNAVCPGWIETDLNRNLFAGKDPAERDQALRALHPIGRLGTPVDVANLVSWLASDEAAWVTGQEFTVDGGRLARLSGIA